MNFRIEEGVSICIVRAKRGPRKLFEIEIMIGEMKAVLCYPIPSQWRLVNQERH
jgi:hypothetical protein